MVTVNRFVTPASGDTHESQLTVVWPSSSVPRTPTVERPKRAIADVQSPQAARTSSRRSAGPPRTESVAVRPIQRTTTRPNLMSAFLSRDDGRLQYHRPGPRSGESLSQVAARNELGRIQRYRRVVRRDPDASFANASPTLRQSQSPDPDDIFAPTSVQPRESVAPYARSGQYRSPTVSDESDVEIDTIMESEVETDTITPSARSGQYRSPIVSDESVESSNVSHTPRAPANHPDSPPDPVQVAGELDVPCLTDADKRLLRNFELALAKNKMTERNPQLPALWSEANELDPGEPPEHLEALGPLTPLEEWLIARVHTRMQVMTYRGVQYKYRGHI
ncbi:hypothetical protein E4U58_006462, partial [Claviceps cyperi]